MFELERLSLGYFQDTHAYTAVGIARSRVFIINPLGTITTGSFPKTRFFLLLELYSLTPKCETQDNYTYKTTYTDLSKLAAEMFPPKKDHSVPDGFSDMLYWRDTSLDDFVIEGILDGM